MKDFYKELELTKSATDAEIKKAYRRLALKHHPDRNNEKSEKEKAEALEKFKAVGEAYEVLSDKQKRAIYDQYGSDAIEKGYSFADGYEVFMKFFGTDNPFSQLFEEDLKNPFVAFKDMRQNNGRAQDPAVIRPLPLTLEELYLGTKKNVVLNKRVRGSDGHSSQSVNKSLSIDVKPGWKAGTKITFAQEGDEAPGIIPADVIFVVEETKHSRFEREGNNLIYHATVPLVKALTGGMVEIETLDNRILKVPLSEVISNDTEKTVSGEGMPLSKLPTQKGDLIIRFNVKFPKTLTSDQKQKMKALLSQ
eukprot:GCRY01002348.1.p1 GENE.GCRY01002348.1~~GCRY01002348.1.p1  ORF type:complete len:307 (+),score=58.31 GCRY01002348.1:189-1109(+)